MMSDEKVGLFENDYKSCFARSMVVNSQYDKQQSKPQEFFGSQPLKMTVAHGGDINGAIVMPSSGQGISQDTQGFHSAERSVSSHNCFDNKQEENSFLRTQNSTNKSVGAPMENFFMQSHMEILQWQLKQTEASREMYRALMKQVVVFLERAHRSLEILGTRLNTKTVPRSRSEHHMSLEKAGLSYSSYEQTNGFKDNVCHWSKHTPSLEESSPEKLSQEAFRLLRTAQSLLNTREPDLAHVGSEKSEDADFITQLAKEFPPLEPSHQRTTSLSLSPKLLTPEKDLRPAFNRKFSLPLNGTELKKSLLVKETLKLAKPADSTRNSVTESDHGGISHIYVDVCKSEKHNSPPIGSISSAEDESGFSSLNSFQEVGLPVVNSEVNIREAPILHSLTSYSEQSKLSGANLKISDDVKLWHKPLIYHQRRNSSPMEARKEKSTLKVLWV